MDIVVTPESQGCYRVACGSAMDWDARLNLAETVAAEAGDDLHDVILDLDNVTHVNSAGIGAILLLRQKVRDRGGRLVLARPSPKLSRLLETVNLPKLVPVVATLDEARAALAGQQGSA
jgi:anti-anti-sigma factor